LIIEYQRDDGKNSQGASRDALDMMCACHFLCVAHCKKMGDLKEETAKTLQFLAAHREEVLRILKDNNDHRIKDNVLKCSVRGTGSVYNPSDGTEGAIPRHRKFYVVTDEMKSMYNLSDGIEGTMPRHNKQNFVILFRGVRIGGNILGLIPSELYNFEDPRDADQVIRALWKLYDDSTMV